MARRAPPGAPLLSRQVETVDPAQRVAIYCEGATEQRILVALRSHWRVAAVTVHVVGEVGVPRTVVDEARTHAKTKHRERPTLVVVFDRDEHESWRDALEMARANDFVLAVSHPCVELFGLLLHRDQTAPIDRHAAQRELKQLHPGYDHNRHPYFCVEVVLQKLDEAIARSKRLESTAVGDGEPFKNPTTSFYRAIELIRPKGPKR